MGKNKSQVSRRAWRFLRMALLWARKGGAFRRNLMVELRVLPNYIKRLRHVNTRESIGYREREFSFDESPLFNFKMHRPASLRFHMPSLPCIKPQVDFDYDFSGDGEDSVYYKQDGRQSYLTQGTYDDEDQEGSIYLTEENYDEETTNAEIVPVEDESIDLKAEEFIENFYREMKMQRQLSYLQYNDMLDRGTN